MMSSTFASTLRNYFVLFEFVCVCVCVCVCLHVIPKFKKSD